MDSRNGKLRMNVEGDRLSSLPDDLIHKILSLFDIKDVIRTSALSSRWRFIWTSMPYLNLSTKDFSTLPKFSKFVTHVLSRRNKLTDVYSLKLSFRGKVSQVFVKRILNYAFSHNIQQLNVVYLVENDIEFPLCLFSSHPLKHLSLTMEIGSLFRFNRRLTSTREISTLTTLDLDHVTLRDDDDDDGAEKCVSVFSKCANLKNLTLKEFDTKGSDGFSIRHPRLCNLTLENCLYDVNVINVYAPQLESLTIKHCCHAKHVVSAPDLASFVFKGVYPLRLCTDGFHSLEKADICVSYPDDEDAHQIFCLLQQLHSVRFLTLNLEVAELLSSYAGHLLRRPSPFVNLKSLKIYPDEEFLFDQAPMQVAMCTELKSYLLDGSPKSTFTMVLREEIEAQKIMAELKMLLEKEKDNTKTNREQGKAHEGESHNPKKLKIGGNMTQIERTKEKARLIDSKLQLMEQLLTRLPASNRAKIQACFYSLCAEAGIAVGK